MQPIVRYNHYSLSDILLNSTVCEAFLCIPQSANAEGYESVVIVHLNVLACLQLCRCYGDNHTVCQCVNYCTLQMLIASWLEV